MSKEAMQQALEWIAERPEDRKVSAGKMVAILREALSQQGEPVAYHFQKHNCFGQFVWDVAFSAPRDATQCFPLYAAPQPAQQEPAHDKKIAAMALLIKSLEAQLSHHRAQADKYREAVNSLESERSANSRLTAELEMAQPAQQPLTDDEIVKIQRSHPAFMTSSCRAFARAVEAAHGIGGGE